jgi:hypothetical protein
VLAVEVIFGCVIVLFPSYQDRQWRGVRDRIVARGGKAERLTAVLESWWWRPAMWLLRLCGVGVIVLAVFDR